MDINEKSINYIKSIAAETVSNANSGHTGSAISGAPILYSLFKNYLSFNPKDTNFLNRDRFVMSAGHASALYYTILHLFGYDITIDDLKNFRTCNSKTPGHPEYKIVPGVETTTGPLGQGIANAVGMAIGETILEAEFNEKGFELFNHHTYCYTGDGCLMEGVAVEACSLAGTLELNKLVLLYEDNNTTIDGTRTLANNEDIQKKFESMNWNAIVVKNGNDYLSITKAIHQAQNSSKPTIIILKTTIGIGTKYQGTSKIHAYPLPVDELADFKQTLQTTGSFFIDDDVYANAAQTITKNANLYNNWCNLLKKYKENHPEKYKKLTNYFSKKAINYQKIIEKINLSTSKSGRDLSGLVLNEIIRYKPELVGGSADLCASTKAFLVNGGDYSKLNRLGKNIHYGIREHAMGSISNGLALYLKNPVFDSTFTVFSNYMLPSIRMRAMMDLPILSIFTHDSINIGQDGPTHQPIESLTTLRSIPNYLVYRPATPTEVVAGYKVFMETQNPTALILTKNKLQEFENCSLDKAEKGGYVIFETNNKPQIEIFATGTEVELAINIAKQLEIIGARVISMPCESLFNSQEKTYKNKVLLKDAVLKVAIEASNDNIWYKYIGENGLLINVTDYQTSGSGSEVYKNAGFDEKKILSKINKLIK